uniref:HAT C-terminal dimerisation domain-containing protein n=1 Tax=Octopus bimaculoides TaxID=37653 RepID=A0A0L8FRS5_OCTBM
MLLAHKNTAKYKKAFDCAKPAIKLDSFIVKNTDDTLNEKGAKADLLLTGYVAEHHIPFIHINHLAEVYQKTFSDSEIAKNLQMKKTKLTYITQDGFAHHEWNEMKSWKFSRNKIENGSSQGVYDAVKSTLTKEDVSMSNILGFASDNYSTLMGNKSGFQKLLINDIPIVFTTGCVCHSFAFCSSHAVKVLPSYLESFLKGLTSYFSRSSKRQNDFNMIQSVAGTKEDKISKLSQTRWLSRENVINVIIEQWDALVLYFQSEAKSIIPLASDFPVIAPENTPEEQNDEWRLFRQYKDIPACSKSIPEFWYSIRNLKDGLDRSKLERLSQFITNLTVLPHSSVCMESIFSQVNCTKTKFPNRLKAETITDRLLAKQAITRKGASCISWEPNAKLIKDVVDGSCHRRYTRRLNFKKAGVNEDDVDIYEIDN